MRFCSVAALTGIALLFDGCSRGGARLDARPNATQEPRLASTPTPAESAQPANPGNNDPSGTLLDGAAITRALPEHVRDFGAGPLLAEPQFVRREYFRGNTKISVTIAVPAATPLTYEEWARMSSASPQVTLDMFPSAGSGFYDCAPQGADELCHVHIHLRSGHHIEMMGQQNAHRADFDALLKQLPLEQLANVKE